MKKRFEEWLKSKQIDEKIKDIENKKDLIKRANLHKVYLEEEQDGALYDSRLEKWYVEEKIDVSLLSEEDYEILKRYFKNRKTSVYRQNTFLFKVLAGVSIVGGLLLSFKSLVAGISVASSSFIWFSLDKFFDILVDIHNRMIDNSMEK